MALSNYTDVYNVKDYSKRVGDIGESISNLSQADFFNHYKLEIKDQIERLRKKEAEIFKIFKVNTLEELNKKIENYRNAVFNLSGPALNQEFIAILKENNKAEFETFNNAVKQVITEDILNNKSYVELGVKEAHRLIMEELNGFSTKNVSVKFSSKKGFMNEDFFPSSFTAAQRKRWETLLKEKYRDKPAVKKYINVIDKKNSGKEFVTEFTWLDYTKELTPNNAKELLTSTEISNMNRKIIQFILSKIEPDSHAVIIKIIENILKQQPTAFFVGKNDKDISGILGEIQGMYYLSKLIDDPDILYKWRGGMFSGNNNKKPHQDLLVDIFGIQVKNTTKDALKWMGSVNFASSGISTFMNKANANYKGDEINLLIENYYATVSFNVPYHKEGNKRRGIKYLPGLSNKKSKNKEIFATSREHLLAQEDKINKLLSLFAASFMYMDVSDNIKKMDANVLYLLGGAALQTASNILKQILEDLEKEERRFNVKASFSSSKTIIDALNDKNRSSNYSGSVRDNIKLTSSYIF